jgi:cyclopropane-fatty-acyl-phospholipid synthase
MQERPSAPALSYPAQLTAERASGPPTRLDRRAQAAIQRSLAGSGVEIRLWDAVSTPGSAPCIVIRDRPTLWKLLLDPELEFGEAYMTARLDVHGDLVDVLERTYRTGAGRAMLPVGQIKAWRRSNSPRVARENIHHHYDIGNDFYRLWLDERLVYTCAYFESPAADLEAAQVAKMDHVCRKLWLRPGERVVEAGCGWGSLALHMAARYGVSVTAFNISREQIAYARERAREEGLEGRVEFIEDDYRNIHGQFDAFMSVGMLEHVGPDHYTELGAVIRRCLDATHGRGLLHFIGRTRPRPLNAWIRRRIFPGAYPPALDEVTAGVLAPVGLAALDVENLRLHYALTIRHWLERFERSAVAVRDMFDEAFVRAWRLYLAGSQVAFTTGWLELFQVVFAPGGSGAVPWTRAQGYDECRPATF